MTLSTYISSSLPSSHHDCKQALASEGCPTQGSLHAILTKEGNYVRLPQLRLVWSPFFSGSLHILESFRFLAVSYRVWSCLSGPSSALLPFLQSLTASSLFSLIFLLPRMSFPLLTSRLCIFLTAVSRPGQPVVGSHSLLACPALSFLPWLELPNSLCHFVYRLSL